MEDGSSEAATLVTSESEPLDRLDEAVSSAGIELPKAGRFVLLRLLGRGAAGSVYSAYDPELDRKIAIKFVVLGKRREAIRARIQREVQAMARINHPNTVQIFDVMDGVDGVYIAMELVEGVNLREWLAQAQRGWREIKDVFVAAGRGLAAAHAANLVHRDFKPANVLIGLDGQVRVADFGLARGEGEGRSSPGLHGEPDPLISVTSSGSLLDDALTRVGALLGTPAYMAPEIYLGGVADSRSDQYAFAVSLFEALFGERPYRGPKIEALRERVLRGGASPPQGTEIPRWLRRVVMRAMDIDPERRFASMNELLEALDRDPAATWRRRLLGAGLGLAAIAGMGLALGGGEAPCQGMEEHLRGTWDGPRREALAAVESLEPRTEAAVAESLDAFAGRWTAMRREACEAELVRAQVGADLTRRRIACLDERLARLRPLVDVLLEADGASVVAAEVIARIPSLDRCADDDDLMAIAALPEEPQAAAEVEEIRAHLARARAMAAVGLRDQAIAETEEARTLAREVDYELVRAEAALLRSELRGIRAEEMIAPLSQAFAAATRAGDERLAIELAIELLFHTSQAGHLRAGEAWLAVVDGLAPRFAGEALLEALIARGRGAFAFYGGDYPRSAELFAEAVDAFARADASEIQPAFAARTNLGVVLSRMGHHAEAAELYRENLLAVERALGPRHYSTKMIYFNLKTALARQGKGAEAARVLVDEFRVSDEGGRWHADGGLRLIRTLSQNLPAPARERELAAGLDLLAAAPGDLRLLEGAQVALIVGLCDAAIEGADPETLTICRFAADAAARTPAELISEELRATAFAALAEAEHAAGERGAAATMERAIAHQFARAQPDLEKIRDHYRRASGWEAEAGRAAEAAKLQRAAEEVDGLVLAGDRVCVERDDL